MAAARAPFDRDTAYEALTAATADLPYDPADAELVRLGSYAVFRLRGLPVIARVGRSESLLPVARREVAVAEWLASAGIPAVRVLDLDLEQPIVVNGRIVTLWESASDEVEYGTPAELAELLRQLHALTPPASLDLPNLQPLGRATDRVDQADGLDEDQRGFLRDKAKELTEAYDGLEFALPIGVVHGDANVGNVFRDRNDRPLFGDLDGFAIGPREWDLLQTAMFFDRYGWHNEGEYRAFTDVYGFDMLAWPGYETLAQTKEFLMVTWMAQNAGHGDAKVDAELAKRIDSLRTGASRKDWAPF
ncbi:phosphotransferase enzyme family protein [Cryptosporangium minutisporangium]|uniref:Aminoglycoside phosphotransferase family protein n=1 Tax=Cryptosporangium minutisporangium TaxID=113569 RepID=A0ABP6SZ72_9ACTN